MTKVILLLFFLAPIIAELVSGVTPPSRFFSPIAFITLTALYGSGALLVRECAVRWNLRWQVIFLTAAYALIEEGLTAKSIFDVNWTDLQAIGGYGMYFGVQWPWTLQMISYHSAISMLIPIAIVHTLYSDAVHRQWLGKRGLALCGIMLAGATLFGFMFMPDKVGVFRPSVQQTIGCIAVISLLVLVAYKSRSMVPMQRPGTVPFTPLTNLGWTAFAFVSLVALVVVPNALAHHHRAPAAVSIAVQFAIMVAQIAILNRAFAKYSNTKLLIRALVIGVELPIVLIAGSKSIEMQVVAALSLIGLAYWWIKTKP